MRRMRRGLDQGSRCAKEVRRAGRCKEAGESGIYLKESEV